MDKGVTKFLALFVRIVFILTFLFFRFLIISKLLYAAIPPDITRSIFFLNKGENDPTKNFGWDYVLVDNDKVVYAWCMPGGKIAFYTGMLDVTKNTNGLAAVMGHEIAHAVAKHSVERASRGVLLNTGARIIDIASGGVLSDINRTTGMDTVGLRAQLGIMLSLIHI